MDERKQGAGNPTRETSEEAGHDACCGGDMKQAMADMMERCGCCEEMMERFRARARSRRTPDPDSTKV